jgi:hypothetical protein
MSPYSILRVNTDMSPQRLQLRRAKGWRLQNASRALSEHCSDGLPARSVARPHPWSNPYVIGHDGDRRQCLARYEQFLLPYTHDCGSLDDYYVSTAVIKAVKDELGGYNLACWCAVGLDCHADFLLAIAND